MLAPQGRKHCAPTHTWLDDLYFAIPQGLSVTLTRERKADSGGELPFLWCLPKSDRSLGASSYL